MENTELKVYVVQYDIGLGGCDLEHDLIVQLATSDVEAETLAYKWLKESYNSYRSDTSRVEIENISAVEYSSSDYMGKNYIIKVLEDTGDYAISPHNQVNND